MTGPGPALLLHLGGAGTFTAAFIVALVFVGMFTLSFAFGRPPQGGPRLSRAWAASWLRASLPRLAVAAAFSGLLFFTSAQFGSGGQQNTICDLPLRPMTQNNITTARLLQAISDLEQVATEAQGDHLMAAGSLFFAGDSHTLSHDIDGPLRSADYPLAQKLCQSVLILEQELAGPGSPDVVAREAGNTAAILAKAGKKLGLTR